MTSQTLTLNSLSKLPSSPDAARQSGSSYTSSSATCLLEAKKSPYQGEHQAKLRHLQAEIEALLQQLQALKQERLASDSQNLEETPEELGSH
jgi:Skp family chaperone for outer membrane proteins